jgi:hypothetical protein
MLSSITFVKHSNHVNALVAFYIIISIFGIFQGPKLKYSGTVISLVGGY